MKATGWKMAAIGAAILGLAAAASASDLTGTWVGSFKCAGLDAAGSPTQLGGASIMEITQTGDLLAVDLDGRLHSGSATDQAGKEEEQGLAVIEACENDGDPAAVAEMAHLKFKITLESLQASLRMSTVSADGGPALCSGSWKRIGTTDPAVPACPVFFSCVCTGVECGLAGSGASGVNGDVVANVSASDRTTHYENGNDNGWRCVAQ